MQAITWLISMLRQTGFTLVETVTVLLIVSILAVFVLPRFFARSSVDARSAQDLIISTARQAQQLAMSKGAAASVIFSTDNVNKRLQIRYTDGGIQTINVALPADISLTSININYNAKGDAVIANNISIGITGTNRTVCIETTGYAHAC